MLQRLKRTTKSLFFGRNGISPNVDKFLNDHGDEFILEMIISRNVISSILTGSLRNLSTFGEMPFLPKNKDFVVLFNLCNMYI